MNDARQLERVNLQLSHEVAERTQERDQARFALQEQERLAVLGRLAAGVGHEVNNPLQYVRQSLDELQLHLSSASVEAREALTDVRDGVERIRRVVEGLRVYGTGAARRAGRDRDRLRPLPYISRFALTSSSRVHAHVPCTR